MTAVVLLASWVVVPAALAAAPTASLGLSKQAFQSGTTDPLTGPVLPGGGYDYQLTASCSGLTQGCINARTVDVLPPDVDYIGADPSPLYTVTYDAPNRTVTIVYTDNLPSPPNPAGSHGIPAGSTRAATLHVRLDPATSAPDGSTITNTAQASADNATPVTDSASITVSVPRTVTPVAGKSVDPNSVVAQSGAVVTATVSVRNGSSASAQVTSLAVADLTAATWDSFDLVSVGPLTRFPAGADQVSVQTCTAAAPCADADFTASPPQPGPTLALPNGVDPGAVTGIRFVFSNSAGAVLPPSQTAGVVPVQLQLRGTLRSTGQPLDPQSAVTVRNCATPTATDQVSGAVSGDDACAPVAIQPGNAQVATAKQFFPDAAGTYTRNGYAVAGQHSAVTAVQQVTNASAVPVTSMTLTDPSATTASDFTDVDVSELLLVFPQGASGATGTLTCSGGARVPISATQGTRLPADCPAGTSPTSVTVTYTGSIPAGATGQLGVHGTLTDAAAGGTTISDCFDGAVAAGPTSATATSCAQLSVENARTTVGGVKTYSSPLTGGALVAGYPVTFTVQANNTGNIADNAFVVTDPADSSTNPFDVVRLTGASLSSQPSDLAAQFVIEVTTDAGTTWGPLAGADLTAVDGVRARLTSGLVAPTDQVRLQLTTVLRDGIPDGTTLRNCQLSTVASVAGTGSSGSVCSPALTSAPPTTGGQVAKLIQPGTLPAPLPGLTPTAQVQLRAQNSGNVPMRRIVITDPDPGQGPDAFFDRVDLTGGLAVNFPPGANRVQVDACLSAAACTAGEYVLGSPAAAPALPGGVAAGEVAGLRFTFTNSDGGFELTPGSNLPSSGPCPGATACFTVTPRTAQRSNGAPIPFPESFSDIATAGGESSLTNGALVSFGSAPAALTVQPGTAQLQTTKTADTSVVPPGQKVGYTLTTSNSGTAPVPGLTIVEPIPAGLVFDNTFNGDGGLPFHLTAVVPAGQPAPPTPQFTPVVDPVTNRITELRWQYPADFAFYPTSAVTITIQAGLDPTVGSGQSVTNTFGATTADPTVLPTLTCASGPPDPTLGCTASATVRAGSGSAVDAEKWVHGTDARGFYNTRTASFVPVGDPSCPLLTDSGNAYTRFPCIALVYAGENFDYLIDLTNVGTTPLTETRLIDYLPKLGDRGVVVTGDRGTQWDPRPLLTAPPALGAGTSADLTVSYAPDSPTCTTDIARPPVACPDGTWSPDYTPDAEAFRAFLTFPTPLAPAGTARLVLAMSSPADLDTSADSLPIAWNSFAHTDFFRQANGTVTQLPPVEPEKVGVALPFGELEIVKQITGNVPPGSIIGPFAVAYSCVVTPAQGAPVTVTAGDGAISPDAPVIVPHVPAGAVCTVQETATGGGNVTQPGPVTIRPDTTADASAPTQSVVVNDFPAPRLIVEKHFAGTAASYASALGPFTVEVTCSVNGTVVDGYPRTLTFRADGAQSIVDGPSGTRLPIGAQCTVSEPDTRGATSTGVTYSGGGSSATISAVEDAVATVTNTYDAADLTVTKTVQGPGPAGPYSFTAGCGLTSNTGTRLPVQLSPADTTFTLSDGGRHVITVPKGAVCTVVEVDTPAGDTATYNGGTAPATVRVDTAATVAVVNTFAPAVPPTPSNGNGGGAPVGPTNGQSSSGTGLSYTGYPVWSSLLAALSCVAAGLLLAAAARRRRPER